MNNSPSVIPTGACGSLSLDMKLQINHTTKDFTSYRAERVKSLFNCEDGHKFEREFDLPVEKLPWRIGVVAGPSGSGKTSIGRKLGQIWEPGWPHDAPVIDGFASDFDTATSAMSAVGLGSVPAWLRPYEVLSNGEKFRVDLARLVADAPQGVTVVDEFSSVIDRQIAQIGAEAFARSWRRKEGPQVVLLTCHYDVLSWLQPDWWLDTATGKFNGQCLRRGKLTLEIHKTGAEFWPLFEPHHYLKLPHMVAPQFYVGFVDGQPVAHVCLSPKFEAGRNMRACRLVILPEWQGIGFGIKFLEGVCRLQLEGRNNWGRQCFTLFHTSHPGLVGALRRRAGWVHVNAGLFGGNKLRSRESLARSENSLGKQKGGRPGYGGHLRAVHCFKFIGP